MYTFQYAVYIHIHKNIRFHWTQVKLSPFFSFIRYMYQIGPVMKPFLVFAKSMWWYNIP